MKKSLSQREKDFCISFVECGNPIEAAKKAGYTKSPEKAGLRLICRSDISDEIARLESQLQQTLSFAAKCGYKRLAFGNIADAVSLLFKENPALEDLKEMDLFSISEIKKPKDGAMEIKFFDRLKALEKLEELSGNKSGSDSPFYEALITGAQMLSKESKDNEY